MNDVIKRKGIGDYPIHSSNPSKGVYSSNVNVNINLDIISRVNENGIRILNVLLKNNSNLSYIHLDQEMLEIELFGRRTRASNAYVYRGIISLLEAGIIFKSVTKNYYWLDLGIINLINSSN